MTSFDSRLLTPPREEEEIYPYRRVWRSIILESGAVIAAAVGLFAIVSIVGIPIPDLLRRPLSILLALLPALLWLVFSYLPERSVQQPRMQLLVVFIISALTANAVAYPFLNETIEPDAWLSLASAVDRIFGYTFTVGIVQVGLAYIILRYTIWSGHIRTRFDVLAYAASAAVGYATVFNLHFALNALPSPDVVAARTLSTFAVQMASNAVLAYGIAESRIGNAPALLMPVIVGFAAFIVGVAIPLQTGLLNGNFGLLFIPEITVYFAAPRPLFGLAFSIAVITSVLYAVYFLIDNAERKQREVESAREV